jgi:hypothetical protein
VRYNPDIAIVFPFKGASSWYQGQGRFLLNVMILEKVTLVERDALGEDLNATKRTEDDMESRLVRYNLDIAIAFPFKGASSWKNLCSCQHSSCLCIITS